MPDGWAQVVVIAVKIWRSFPFMMLSLLAALQGIDRALYEAAAIDGASRWQNFLHITLPQLRNVSIVLCILMTIWTINDFETPFLITGGGPSNATENLILLAYRYTFARNQVGSTSEMLPSLARSSAENGVLPSGSLARFLFTSSVAKY